MTIKIDSAFVQNLQTLEAAVSGPEGANRLFTITGTVPQGIYASSTGNQVIQKETYAIRVGPTFKRQQFYRAIASAALTALRLGPGADVTWSIATVDADWDDETQQVEVTVELSISITGPNVSASINGFGFQVNILAALPES